MNKNKNYIKYHVHTECSLLDSCTNYKLYVDRAVELGQTAMAFTEHGNTYNWVDKKLYCNEKGLKYIHGIEIYLTASLDEKIRDNYHTILLAKNYEGVKEINLLVDLSTQEDHFYYKPRLTFDEFFNISDNVIKISACLASPLNKYPNDMFTSVEDQKKDLKFKLDEDLLAIGKEFKDPKCEQEWIEFEEERGSGTENLSPKPPWAYTGKTPHDCWLDYCKERAKKRKSEYEKSLVILNNMNKYKDTFEKLLQTYDYYEIQPHNCLEQIQYNKMLYEASKKYNKPLIVGTDTHSIDKYKAECRSILQKAKGIEFSNEDVFDLTDKTYDELVEMFRQQNSLPMNIVIDALDETNIMADSVVDFELDKSFKYPKLYDNEEQVLKQRIVKKLKEKIAAGIIDKKKEKEYNKNIIEEFKVFKKINMVGFMLFMSELVCWCWEHDIPIGFCRGSVGGSTIAYITDIIDVDPIVWNTVFSRFANEDRLEIGDIDIDISPSQRHLVYEHIIEQFDNEHTAYILAIGTISDKGTIDEICRALSRKWDIYKNPLPFGDDNQEHEMLEIFDRLQKDKKTIRLNEIKSSDTNPYSLDIAASIKNLYGLYTDQIAASNKRIKTLEGDSRFQDFIKLIDDIKTLDKDSDEYRFLIDYSNQKTAKANAEKSLTDLKQNLYPDIFYYFDGLLGTSISQSMHPAGIIVAPITLPDNYGTFWSDGKRILCINMEECHEISLVKYDLLGLKNIEIIHKCCKYVGIKYPKSYEINWNDEKVWDAMIKNPCGIFQFEGEYAFSLLQGFVPTCVNDLSLVNASLRPSGESYRDRLLARLPNKNPSKLIDDLLADNNGYLVFQEDTIKFLKDICGLSGSDADNVRRAIGRKQLDRLQKALPEILEGYCNMSSQPREVAEEEAKAFLKIIEDSSNYQFGYNHSTGYSMIGYVCAYMRYYYPEEFIAAYLNCANNSDDIKNGTTLAKDLNISIYNIKFGHSKADYSVDKKNHALYKGMESIKFLNSQIADELYELSKNHYDSFIDLLLDINTKTSVNSRQLTILTGLDFFSDFGKNKYLLDVIELCNGVKADKKLGIKAKPSLLTCKQIKKDKLEELGISEYLCKKYASETEKQFTKIDNIGLVKELIKRIENKPLNVVEQVKLELTYLEYVIYTNPRVNEGYYIVTDYKHYKEARKPYVILHNIKTGEDIKTRITSVKLYENNPFGLYSILRVTEFTKKNKKKCVGGNWVETEELEDILTGYEVIK